MCIQLIDRSSTSETRLEIYTHILPRQLEKEKLMTFIDSLWMTGKLTLIIALNENYYKYTGSLILLQVECLFCKDMNNTSDSDR